MSCWLPAVAAAAAALVAVAVAVVLVLVVVVVVAVAVVVVVAAVVVVAVVIAAVGCCCCCCCFWWCFSPCCWQWREWCCCCCCCFLVVLLAMLLAISSPAKAGGISRRLKNIGGYHMGEAPLCRHDATKVPDEAIESTPETVKGAMRSGPPSPKKDMKPHVTGHVPRVSGRSIPTECRFELNDDKRTRYIKLV